MIALALALVLSQTDTVLPVALDAPLAVEVKKGDVVPNDGVLLSTSNSITQAKRVAGCEAERDSLRATGPSVFSLVLIGIAGLAVGATVGTVLTYTLKH